MNHRNNTYNTDFAKTFIIYVCILCSPVINYAQSCSTVSPNFTFTMNHNGCIGPDTIHFTNTSTGIARITSTYYWTIEHNIFDTTVGLAAPINLIRNNGIYRISLVVVSPTNCRDTFTRYVFITPKPTAGFTNVADTVCLGSPAVFKSTSTGTFDSTLYKWTFRTGSTLNTYNPIASFNYTSIGTYTVTLQVYNNIGCTSTVNRTIRVMNGPTAIRMYDDLGAPRTTVTWSRCISMINATDSFTKVFASPDTLRNYVVDFGDGSTASGSLLLPYPTNYLYHKYTQMNVYDFIITSRNSNGCLRIFRGKVVNLRVPTVGIGGPHDGQQSGCTPVNISFFNGSTNVSNKTTFTWDWGDGTTELLGSNNALDSIHHIYMSTVCNVTITLTAENECGRTQTTWGTVNAYTKDDASFSGISSLCYPDTSTLLSITTNLNCNKGNRYYFWDFGDATNSGWLGFGIPQSHKFPGPGMYKVIFSDSNICGIDTSSRIVSIYKKPKAHFTVNTVCQGIPTTFVENSTIPPGNGSITSYLWNFGDGITSTTRNPNHTYINHGVYNARLIVRSNYGCPDTFFDTVHVIESPVIFSTAIPGFSICDHHTIQFRSTITSSTINVDSNVWYFGDGAKSPAKDTGHTYLSNGSYLARLIAYGSNGCSRIDSHRVTVYSSPTARFKSDSICFTLPTTFTDSSTTINGERITKWQWDFNTDGIIDTTIQNPQYTFKNWGMQNITLYIETEFGCKDTVRKTSFTNRNPSISFKTNDTFYCKNVKKLFLNNSTFADSFVWNFGDGTPFYYTTSKSSFYHQYDSELVYKTVLRAFNKQGCKSADSLLIPVKITPNAVFNPNTSSGCEPLSVKFNNNTLLADSYLWDFGNGMKSSHRDTTLIFLSPFALDTTYTVRLIATKGYCNDTSETTILVSQKPEAKFSISQNSGCSPLYVQFINLSSHASKYFWNFNNGDTSSKFNPNAIFINNQFNDMKYDISLIASTPANCFDTASGQIIVHTIPYPLYTSDRNQGCTPLIVNFSNHSIFADSFVWDFGDGGNSQLKNPKHTFTTLFNDTTYNIRLFAKTKWGCTDTFNSSINVFGSTLALFSEFDTGCSPFNMSFKDLSTNASFWIWDFGDGKSSSLQNPANIYFNPGKYSVTLRVFNKSGCSDTFSLTNNITVFPTPKANFVVDKYISQYPDLTFNFSSLSTSTYKHYWDFGDGNTSTLVNPSHSYPKDSALYTAKLTVSTSFCNDSVEKNIRINPPVPVPGFLVEPKDGCVPLTIQFTDTSLYATDVLWYFGDGESSTLRNPTHTYIIPGLFSITLIADNIFGRASTYKKDIIDVHPIPNADFEITPPIVYLPHAEVGFINLTIGGHYYKWYLNNNLFDNVFEPNLILTKAGLYDVTLIAINQFGCADTITKKSVIRVDSTDVLIVPNAFTPANHDGLNDIFKPVYIGISSEQYHFQIFNRWGERIFETYTPDDGWDGTFGGTLCENELYYWLITYKSASGTQKTIDGKVDLLR